MKSWLRVTVGLLALAITGLANAAVSAYLDEDQVAQGDSVLLTIVHDHQTSDRPDLAPLEKDFDVLGQQSSTSVQIVNGSTSARTQITLTLSPKHSGALTVPPIAWSGEKTQPLTLNVTNGAGAQRGQGNPSDDQDQARSANVFLETEVDPKQPLVQAAVNVTVKLYVAERLYQANLDLEASDDVIVRKVGDDQQAEATRNGRTYQVVTRHYLVFPQHSGTIKLAGAVLTAHVEDRRRSNASGNDPFSNFFGRSPFGSLATRAVRLHGDDITLNVQPRPAGFESGYWLPARQVTLEGDWSPTNLQAHVGDPITLTLHLQAEGQTAAQLPDLSALLELPDGMKAYPDQAKLDNSLRGDAIIGTRSQSIALIADEPGQFSLPDLKVRWWDTTTGQSREATLPSKTLVILPATGALSTSKSANPATSIGPAPAANRGAQAGSNDAGAASSGVSNEGRWRWIALGLGLLWLATLAAWLGSKWLARKREPASASTTARSDSAVASLNATQARAEFQAACQRNDALAARRALLAWARAKTPHAPPVGLNALAKQIEDVAIATQIRELDRACYAGETWQSGPLLSQVLTELPTVKSTVSSNQSRPSLAPLYP